MSFTYKLVRERCRVRVEPDAKAQLEVVYALNRRPPMGTRQQLVPTLKKMLAKQNLQLIALDLFDEFVKLHLPLEASTKTVEAALAEALSELKTSPPTKVPREAEAHLRRYLGESPR